MMGRLAGVMLTVAAVAAPGRAADHRDGPRIAQNTPTLGNLDLNDVYLFRAPHGDHTVMIMTLSAAAGVVGPAHFYPGATYEFRVDNTGDTTSDVIFQLVFSEPNAQGRQSYTVHLMASSPHQLNGVIGHGTTSIGSEFRASALPHGGKVAAGLFDDPFFFDLLAFNKFIAAADNGEPLGARVAPFLPPNIPNDFFGDFNAIAIVMEVSNSWLRASPRNTKISLWCRTLADVADGRGFAQYDRMGIPAINTAVIQPGMPRGTPPQPPGDVVPPGSTLDEDNFNFGSPQTDASLRQVASARIQFAYGVTAAYADQVAAFVLPDALPFDTRTSSGFPNGRRLADDVIDAEFKLLTNGALTGDRVINDSVFRATFPYLGAPLPRAATLRALGIIQPVDPAAGPMPTATRRPRKGSDLGTPKGAGSRHPEKTQTAEHPKGSDPGTPKAAKNPEKGHTPAHRKGSDREKGH
jgi:hypothetical protein